MDKKEYALKQILNYCCSISNSYEGRYSTETKIMAEVLSDYAKEGLRNE